MSVIFVKAVKRINESKLSSNIKEAASIGFISILFVTLYSITASIYKYVITKEQFLSELKKQIMDSGVRNDQAENIITSFSPANAVYQAAGGTFLTALLFISISGLLSIVYMRIYIHRKG